MKKIEKIKRSDIDFSSYQRDREEFEQNNTSIALNVLFASHNSEEIKFAYKSRYKNERKNHVILLMINDKAKNCYDNTFQNALNAVLNDQNIEKDPQRITKIEPYISKYN